MRPTRLFWPLCLLTLLFTSTALADATVTIADGRLTVTVNPGNPAVELTRELIVSTPGFDAWSQAIRACDIVFYKATNDSTTWTVVRTLKTKGMIKNEDEANQNADAAVNWGRGTKARIILDWAGVPEDAICIPVPLRDEKCLIEIWGRSLEREVSQYIPAVGGTDTLVVVDNREPQEPSSAYWDMDDDYVVLGLGLATTRHSVAPHATIALNVGDAWLLQGHGHHQLFLRHDRSIDGDDRSTFDRGAGFRLGRRVTGRWWLTGGWIYEESILDETSFAGRRTYRTHSGELSVAYATDSFSLSLAGLYGHEWTYDEVTEDALGLRVALTKNFTLTGGR